MQLCHTHRQLLSRCILRWYSAGTGSDVISASDLQVPPRLKRPVASSFGGINIQNVVVPTRSVSHNYRNKTKNPSRSDGSLDQSPDMRHMSQTEHKGMGRGGGSSHSGWGDGLVSLSFASRLQLRQDKSTTRGSDTEPHSQEAQSRKQKPYQAHQTQTHGHRRGQQRQQEHDDSSQTLAYHPQTHGNRRGQQGQQEHDDASQTQTHRRHKTATRTYDTVAAVQEENRTSAPSPDAKNNKLKASSMTRPSSSPTFKRHPKSTTAEATATKITKADTASLPSSSNAPATQHQQPTITSSDRKARLATLSSTNLNELFRTTTNTATAGYPYRPFPHPRPPLPPTPLAPAYAVSSSAVRVITRASSRATLACARTLLVSPHSVLRAMPSRRSVTFPSASVVLHCILLEDWCNHVVRCAHHDLVVRRNKQYGKVFTRLDR
ncbi:hypothetical protein BGY98DRAFT_228542 [Russula aff. rugulosa BPL654]|nr:hypothetical protein BGY98DRAFT_228542 [Russula aff. rugulosa BPL654]